MKLALLVIIDKVFLLFRWGDPGKPAKVLCDLVGQKAEGYSGLVIIGCQARSCQNLVVPLLIELSVYQEGLIFQDVLPYFVPARQ